MSPLTLERLRRTSSLELAGSMLVVLLMILPELDRSVRAGPVTVTPGRVLLAVAAAAACADAARYRTLSVLRRPLIMTLLAAVLAAVGLVLFSVGTNGCNCQGSAAGLIEFAMLVVLATYVLSRDGTWTFRLLGAAGVGTVLAAVLSAPELRSGLRTRIAGPYGNPNNLAIVLASGVPIAVAAALQFRRRARTGLIAVALLLGLGTFFTYSREALLSLAAALVVFGVLRASVMRTRLLIVLAAVALAGLSAALYPSFERSRVQADLGSQATLSALALRLSGDQAAAVGWISEGSARVAGSGGALDVFAHAGQEGTSLGLGEAQPGVHLLFTVRARALHGPVSFSIAMIDQRVDIPPARRTLELTPTWRQYTLAWTPSRLSADPGVFLYTNAAGSFEFYAPTLQRGQSGQIRSLTLGLVSSESLTAAGEGAESNDINFREQMLSLAWRAFIDHPIRGIGWEEFPDYADAHSVYGHQGAQSEYGRYVAELGIGGLIVLLVIAIVAVMGLRRRSPSRDVVASVLTVWALGLLFDNALETISMSAILALGLAIACVRPIHAAPVPSFAARRSRRPADTTPAPGSGGYRPALDGVRAVAVSAVVAYHLNTRLRGGFLGVDVFFVLSGYLITSMLLREHSRTGRINALRFWGRRARRLLPAVLVLVAVVALWTAHHNAIVTFPSRRADMLSTIFYVANWHFIAVQQSYFALFTAGVSPLEHMWSLAIEEQFYLLWPLALAALMVILRRKRRPLLGLVLAVSVASAALMALLYQPADPTRAYVGTDTRAFELLIGAALAIVIVSRPALATRAAASRAARWMWPGLIALVLIAFVELNDQSSLYFRGGALAFSVVVAVGLGLLEVRPQSLPARALSVGPMRWLGTVSYSLYLWHWPIIVWTSERALTWPHAVRDAVQAALALGVGGGVLLRHRAADQVRPAQVAAHVVAAAGVGARRGPGRGDGHLDAGDPPAKPRATDRGSDVAGRAAVSVRQSDPHPLLSVVPAYHRRGWGADDRAGGRFDSARPQRGAGAVCASASMGLRPSRRQWLLGAPP